MNNPASIILHTYKSHSNAMMKKSGFILAVFMLTLFLGKPLVKGDDGSFISRRGVQFMSNGGVFYANGFNAYWMMIQAANPSTRPKVSSILQEASSYGLTIARTWAFSDGGSLPLQISPGSYNEQMFQGLDFVVAEAKRCGIKLIMSLVNNYADYGGKPQYAQWANLANEDDFFTNPVTKGIYKNHIKTVLTRVNTITKVAYKDDPTIMAWELMNEPRCKSDTSGRTLQNWVGEMAAYVKSIDSNHLLEIGLEGFYGASTPEKIQMNPHSVMYGTDFIANNQIPGIDFATVHSYPDQWLSDSSIDDQFGFLNQWVYQHIADAQNTLQMPVVFAEFGKSYKLPGFNPADSVTLYSVIYNGIYSSASKGGAAASGLFWQLVAEGMDTFRDGYEIVLKDSASLSSLIADESQKMSNLCKRDRRRKLLDFSS